MKLYDLSVLPDLHPELGILLGALNDGTREWREYLEEPTIEEVTWTQYPKGPSIGGLLLHMAAAEQDWLEEVATGTPVSAKDPAVEYNSRAKIWLHEWPVPPANSIHWYFELLDTNRARMTKLILAHNDPSKIHQSRSQMTYRWVLAHLVQHDSYHGGQAVLLHEVYKKIGPRKSNATKLGEGDPFFLLRQSRLTEKRWRI